MTNNSKRSSIDFDKLLNNPEVEKIMSDTSHECWCQNCGNTQGVNHLGSQPCNNCGARNWMNAESFRKYREANKNSFKEIGTK